MGLDIEKVAMLTGMVDKLIQIKHVDNALDESVVEELIQKHYSSAMCLTVMMRLQPSNGILPINIRYKHVLARAFWQIMSKPTGMTTEKLKFSRISGHDTRII